MCQNWGLVDIHNGVLCLECDHLATFQAGGQMCRGTINWNKRPLKIIMLPFPYPDVTYPPKSQEVFSLACADGAALGEIRDEHCTAFICIYDRERLRLTLHREIINPSVFTSRWKDPHHFTTEWANIWGLRIETGQVQSAPLATPSIFRGQTSKPLKNENSFPSGSTSLRNVKTEHFEEDQVYVGEEDQALVKDEDQALVKDEDQTLVKDEDQTLVGEENHISFHEVDHVPVGRGDKVLVDEEDHISFHEENQVFIDEEREQGEEKKEEEEGYEEDSHEESYQKGYEEDYEEDEDDPDAKETDSDYGNELYDLDDMKSCLKEPPIQRLGVPGSPAASYVVSWGSSAAVNVAYTMYRSGFLFNLSPSAGGLFSGHEASSGRWKSDNFIGKVYTYMYRKPLVRFTVSTILKLAEKCGISGHVAAMRWIAFYGNLDVAYGDAIIFGVFKVEQLYSILNTLEAGLLPEDLAAAITAVYSIMQGAEPPYHL
ncbi:aflatoxin B1 aldehyde reductase member 2 [Colletotrichum abscissum]|uniref:Aflatoxin B1 aldehyde reductase member 2 n=1 Tax=Colletotrichum abscissum TaxID=1671311 RepID=A0A9P9X5M6_9PEZI|nr:aflatoxin B1 aldehyde reductase member 2 [Colletotrichum abscissum]KAI3538341.1 aflatoxin B1 aldehyde reductase member 2 [Colletotrichum abscissum]KAK1508924.1 aflatoxin B1 aldehyde reductase member 2 [Colletotrichum abscissum]